MLVCFSVIVVTNDKVSIFQNLCVGLKKYMVSNVEWLKQTDKQTKFKKIVFASCSGQ